MSDSIKDILVEMGYDLLDRGKNFRTKPLYRDSDSDNVLSIDKESGVWYDFKEKKGGKFEELVRISLKQEDATETKEWIRARTNGHVTALAKKKPELKTIKKYPKEILYKLGNDHSYWVDRGIAEDVIKIFGGGLAGNGQMTNRYVFPIFNSSSELVGFTGRYVKEAPSEYDIPKWKHVGTVSGWCYPLKYNIKTIQEKKEVILVESVGDMLALWSAGIENVMVTFGLRVSKAFNNDSRNNYAGNNAAKEVANKLLLHFDKEQVRIALPSKNDFGDMKKTEIQRWYFAVNENDV